MESLDTFQFGDHNVANIAHICRLLDGVPLAIEMAAASVAHFGLRGLAVRLGDELGSLSNNRRTAIPPEQTLRATLDWSYNLLSRVEQRGLLKLAVFAESFDIGAASRVLVDEVIGAAEVLDVIATLVAKSLIISHRSEEPALYQLPHLLRAYLLEKLRSTDEYEEFRAQASMGGFATVLASPVVYEGSSDPDLLAPVP